MKTSANKLTTNINMKTIKKTNIKMKTIKK